MAFNFPDPAVSTTATNPVTGAQYQWKADPGKWVLTGGPAAVTPPVTIDLLPPESPQVGDLWIHQESLIEYAWDGTQWFEVGSSCGGESEEEEEKDFNVPFTNSYKLVSPNNFTGEDGTATLETDAYANGDDSFLSPIVEIARFAGRDLNGKKHEGVNIDESFELAPTTYETSSIIKPAYGKFKVTSLQGFSEYSVDYDNNRAFRFIEGDTIYYRPSTGDYVKKAGGDTMEGQLVINGPRKAGDDVNNPNLVSSLKVLNIDNAQNSSLQLRHSGNAKVYIGDTDISIASNIKFNRAQGAVVKTNVQDLLNISDREIAYLGQSIEDEDLITKKYVDDTKDFLQNEIVELEEEIEALAPSIERGKWTFTAVGTVASAGQFTMYDAEFGNGSPTGLFKSTKSIWFNEIDSDGTPHAFGDVDDGELLEIFVEGSPEYGLYEVVGQAHNETGGATQFWVIDVNFIRSLEATTAIGPGELCRFKVFMAPTGGDASSFVMKTGDEMTGPLVIESQKDIVDYSLPPSNHAHIEFLNKKSTGQERTTYIYKPGFSYDLVCNNPFWASGLYTAGNLYGYREKVEADGIRTREAKNPRISFVHDDTSPDDRNKDYGEIKFGSKDRLKWHYSGGEISSDTGQVIQWNSSYGYLTGQSYSTCLTWSKDGIVVLKDSYGSTGTEGQILKRTADANYIQWTTPADDGPKNWDLINANNNDYGNDYYYTNTSDAYRTLNSSGGVYNTNTAYGIWMSENMLQTLLNNDFGGQVNMTDWASYWTGGGTITFKTDSSSTPIVRTLTEVEQVTMSGYPGVKFMFSETANLKYYMQWVTTQDAFIQTPGSGTELIMPLVFPNISGSYYANDDQIQSLNRNGYVDSVTYGFNIPWVWFEKNYPDIIGWVQDGLGAFIGDKNATLSQDTSTNRPGLKILGASQVSGRPNVTIPGWFVRVDEVQEPQWGHKFP